MVSSGKFCVVSTFGNSFFDIFLIFLVKKNGQQNSENRGNLLSTNFQKYPFKFVVIEF